MTNLVFTWKEQCRDAEAVGPLGKSVRLRERILQADYLYFISSSNALARWEAEQRDTDALAKAVVAEEHKHLISQME